MPKMRGKSDLPAKPCVECGRPIVWRKAWVRTWDQVLYCSDRCQKEAAAKRKAAGRRDPSD
ncbi:DUF2256 domain-containing protein [Aureimonas sp. AU20]|uniref:DUF2256 domain-containing protein n=1 Tax=Aureimonas sp. AU20 TaxID=1349819 RepID=UPI0009EBE8E1|nr:DUF2256 domain-containing protein [Aureimonas sp. AU20]